MRKLRSLLVGAFSLVFIVAGAKPILAQSDAARLQGIITDQSGGVVPQAKVKVTEVSTNRILETASTPDSGTWSFPVLPPGSYTIEVSKDGFKPIKRNITLQVAQVANVDF